MNASYYEPPDPGPGCGHEDECGIEHDPELSECYTRDDFLADQADAAYDRRKDGE